MQRPCAMLRSGDWLTCQHVRFVAAVLPIASAAGFLFLVATAHDDIDVAGRSLLLP
jgi:hypothetical protein